MSKTKQKIDVGGPRADAVQRRQRVVRGVGVLVRQYVEIQSFRGQFAREILQGLDLRRRQTEPAQPVGAGAAQRVMVKRIERGADAGPDRRGAGGGELLAADDRGQASIAGLAAAQRRHARNLKYRFEPRILFYQDVDGLFEVDLGVEVDDHCDLKASCPVKEINATPRFPFCAEPERLSASRPRLLGVAEFR